MREKSWVLCAQPYPVEKVLFEQDGVWCAGKLSAEKMDEIDEALFFGLCMGLQNEVNSESDDRKKFFRSPAWKGGFFFCAVI